MAPDLLTVNLVLKVIGDYIPIEKGIVMNPSDESIPAIHSEFQEILASHFMLKAEVRADFYREARSEDVCLAVATGDQKVCQYYHCNRKFKITELLLSIDKVRINAIEAIYYMRLAILMHL